MTSWTAKAIIPNIPSNPKSYLKKMQQAGSATAQQIRRDYGRTVRTWRKKPKIVVTQSFGGNEYTFTVEIDSDLYEWIDLGTDPYVIEAKNAPFLTFRTGFTPKTSPNQLGTGAGGTSGGWASVKKVNHPGIEARNFTEIIRERYRTRWQREANKLLRLYLQDRRPAKGR